ncbi:MAG: vanadium-dependent haloperoxidase [Opitutaceae bacterium]
MKAILHPLRAARAALTFLVFAVGSLSAADSVERWNTVITEFSRNLTVDAPPGLPPFLEVRVFAMTHLAILEAVKTSLKPGNVNETNVDAAVAAAAHDVLVVQFGFLPPAGGLFGSIYATELAAIPNGRAKDRGIAIGQAAAAAMLATRASEDPFAALLAPYTPGSNPGDYQLLPPAGVAGAGWSGLTTFTVKNSAQFRAPPPYASLASLEYAMDVNEIAALGKAGSLGRTADQTAIAFYWYENSSFAWNEIARGLAAGKSLLEHARLFAAVNAAISDAYSTSLESKFHYNFWRPITAIRAADTDGNPLTKVDVAWEPAFITPPVPDYPSAHAAAGGAASEVIIALLGDGAFAHTSSTFSELSAATRHFDSVAEAAAENAYSRMLVGIHFRRACTVGLEQGKAIGRYVIEKSKFLNN